MASDQKLIIELIRAKMINAKREKETAAISSDIPDNQNYWVNHWSAQEIAFKQLLTILE